MGGSARKGGTATVRNGKVTYAFSKNLAVGRHSVKVVFTPTSKDYKASTSKSVTLTVNR